MSNHMSRSLPLVRLAAWAFALGIVLRATAAEPQTYCSRDTLDVSHVDGDVGAALAGLRWKPSEFTIERLAPASDDHHAVIRFPSPLDSGDATNDRAALIWHRALPTAEGTAPQRTAMVVVHESGSAMPVGKAFAKAFAAQGVDAFLIHLPFYGLRRAPGVRHDGEKFLLAMRQAVADVRRARDVVAALPEFRDRPIALQGTSLGGFVSASVAGLDRGYDATYIMLAGGDLDGLLQNGQKEAAQLRERLANAGYVGDRLKELLTVIEPNRLASRVQRERTWLYSAEQDRVVPLANAESFVKAAGLPQTQHVRLWGDHTTTIVYFPVIIRHVIDRLPE